MSGERRGILEPTIFAIVGVAILVGLGVWQLDRKVWKENLIAAMNARLSHAPGDLPPREDWGRLNQQRKEFTRVGFPAELLPGQEALVYSAGSAFRPDVKGPGYWVFAPARTPNNPAPSRRGGRPSRRNKRAPPARAEVRPESRRA